MPQDLGGGDMAGRKDRTAVDGSRAITAPPRLVASREDYAALLEELRREPVLAVDTEAASFHRHANRIYLIQVSTPRETAIVDPLAITDLGGLGALLADPAVEVVFHDADYDLRLLDQHHGIRVANLFDTRIAAELLNEPGLSLAALLDKYLDVKVDKRFQRADWSQRPLSDEMLAYAAGDTRHLVTLRDLLAARLEDAGRTTWAREEFRLLEQVRWTRDGEREPPFLRVKGAKVLQPRQLAILREVHAWRAGLAERLDRAEFRILGNEPLLTLAREAPTTLDELAAIRGIGKETVQRRGRAILAAIRRGLRVPPRELPRVERPPRRAREPEVEARLARLKAARTQVADTLGLAPGVVCPNSLLEAIARELPQDLEALAGVDGIRRWQVASFGRDLLDALKTP
jgi:ribonuclease D